MPSRIDIAVVLLLGAGWSPPAAGGELQPIIRAAERANSEGDPQKAARLYLGVIEKAVEAGPSEREAVLTGLLGSCRALITAGRLAPALKALAALISATSGNPIGPAFSGDVRSEMDSLAFDLVMSDKPALAVEALKVLMADGPGPPLRWALLARAYTEQGEFERATQTLRRGLSQFPASPELLFVRAALAGSLSELAVSRANYAAAESMLQRAGVDLEQAIEKESGAPGIHRALGKIRGSLWVYYRAIGQYRKSLEMLTSAEDSYDQAAFLDTRNPNIPFELAGLLFTAQDWAWAEQTYRIARRRYQTFLARTDLSAPLRRVTQQHLQHCRDQIAMCLHNRAVLAAGNGHFERARELVQQAAADHPGFRAQARRLSALLLRAEKARAAEIRRFLSQPDSVSAQIALGDLWASSNEYERAEEAYRRALRAAPDDASRHEVERRLFGIREMPDTARQLDLGIGELLVRAELPPDLDAGRLLADLEKAHALTMGVFAHRLRGPLNLIVFANRRLFLQRAGVNLSPGQEGLYAFGRVVTFVKPRRSRAAWLDILVHEISHRYVDEMTYSRAPHWLSEGLAQWASWGWRREHQRRFDELASSGRLIPWSELDPGLDERWRDPLALDAVYLQSHQIVDWLMRSYSSDRVMTLLAGLRQGHDLDEAFLMAFGGNLDALERRWTEKRR